MRISHFDGSDAFALNKADLSMCNSGKQYFQIETALGCFGVELNSDAAPITSAYFGNLLSLRILVGSSIFRIVTNQNAELRQDAPINVVQLGIKDFNSVHATTLVHEDTQGSGLCHMQWSISSARQDIGENYASFFICMRDEPELDYGGKRHPDGQGFACFGKVIEGFEVVTKIFERAESTEYLTEDIQILGTDEILTTPSAQQNPLGR